MDTKKIEGFVYTNNLPNEVSNRLRDVTVTFFPEEDPNSKMTVPATLVLGKAYTKEEVEAILREAISKTNDRGAVDVLTIKNIAERNGIKP